MSGSRYTSSARPLVWDIELIQSVVKLSLGYVFAVVTIGFHLLMGGLLFLWSLWEVWMARDFHSNADSSLSSVMRFQQSLHCLCHQNHLSAFAPSSRWQLEGCSARDLRWWWAPGSPAPAFVWGRPGAPELLVGALSFPSSPWWAPSGAAVFQPLATCGSLNFN